MLTLAWALVFAATVLSFVALSLRFFGPTLTLFIVPLTFAIGIWGATELLSLFNQLQRLSVLSFWIALLLLTFSLALVTNSFTSLNRAITALRHSWGSLTLLYKTALLAVALIWAISFLIAIASPPNNWDSMTYHMPRVMHWITNENVNPYFTANSRQIVQPPLSSYLILQTVITTQDDYLANLINWTAGALCLLVISAIAFQLTRNTKISVLSFFFTAIIPIGIAESTTTQNEWLMTLWPLLMCLLWISYLRDKILNSWQLCGLSFAVMFAAASTKQQALLYSLIFLAALVVSLVWRGQLRVATPVLVGGAFASLLALSPQLVRNRATFGSIWGPPDLVSQVAGRDFLNPITQIRSGIGHALFNLPVPKAIPVEEIGDALFGLLNSSTNAVFEAAGWSRYLPFPGLQLHEDSAASPVSFFGGTIALLLLLRSMNGSFMRLFAVSALVLGLSVVLIWEAFIGSNRYLLPYFALSSIALAYFVIRWPTKFQRAMIVGSALYGVIFVFIMEYRPLVGKNSIFQTSRIDLYLSARPELRPQFEIYKQAVATMSGSDIEILNVGVCLGGDDYEYPLWKVTNSKQLSIQHLCIDRKTPPPSFGNYDLFFCWSRPLSELMSGPPWRATKDICRAKHVIK